MECTRISEVYMVGGDKLTRMICALLGKPDLMVDPESEFIVRFASENGKIYTGYFAGNRIPSEGNILEIEKTHGIYNMEDASGNRYWARVHEE